MTKEQKQLIKNARLVGVWYLILAISGILGVMVFHSQIFVSNDPQKTLNNLITHISTSRLRLLFELLIVVSQALAAVWFYKLFCDINRWAASTLGIWGTVNSVVIMVSAISMYAAIETANSSIPTVQEKALLIQLFGQIMASAWLVGGLFFGLWLLPMGYIVISSGRMPIWLGRTLILGGIGYILQTFITCMGVKSSYLDILVMPATVGEFWMIGYLLIYGIRPAMNNDNQKK
jgi:Domain of unknown function (DUF4386)